MNSGTVRRIQGVKDRKVSSASWPHTPDPRQTINHLPQTALHSQRRKQDTILATVECNIRPTIKNTWMSYPQMLKSGSQGRSGIETLRSPGPTCDSPYASMPDSYQISRLKSAIGRLALSGFGALDGGDAATHHCQSFATATRRFSSHCDHPRRAWEATGGDRV